MTVLTIIADEASDAAAEEAEYTAWATELWESFELKTGVVKIEEAGAVLTAPESFYYLDKSDAEKILVEIWGNPPGQPTLGMY